MDDRFDQEFYRSTWQRVLPAGPHGIQPYVRTARRARGLPTGRQGLIGLLAAVARGVIALGRWAASGLATRPLPLTDRPARTGVVLAQSGPRRAIQRGPNGAVWPAPRRLKKLKQLSALADISAKHRAAKRVAIPAGDAWTGVTRMARTRDVLDELAEWYAPPASPAPAWHGASSPRRFVAPP